MGILDNLYNHVANSDLDTFGDGDSSIPAGQRDTLAGRIINGDYDPSDSSSKIADSSSKTAEATGKTAESSEKTAESTRKTAESSEKTAASTKKTAEEASKAAEAAKETATATKKSAGIHAQQLDKLNEILTELKKHNASVVDALTRDSGSTRTRDAVTKSLADTTTKLYRLLQETNKLETEANKLRQQLVKAMGDRGGSGGFGGSGGSGGSASAQGSGNAGGSGGGGNGSSGTHDRWDKFVVDTAHDLYSNAMGYTSNPYSFLTNTVKTATSGIPVFGGFIGAGMDLMNQYVQAALARDNATKSLLTTTGLTAGIGRSGNLTPILQGHDIVSWAQSHEGYEEQLSKYGLGYKDDRSMLNPAKRDDITMWSQATNAKLGVTGGSMLSEGIRSMYEAGNKGLESTFNMLRKAFAREGVDEFAAMGVTDTQAAQYATQAYMLMKGGYADNDHLRRNAASLVAYQQAGIDAGQIGGLNAYYNSGVKTDNFELMGAIQAMQGVGVGRNPIDASDFAKAFQQYSQAFFQSSRHMENTLLDQVKVLSGIQEAAEKELGTGSAFEGQFLGQTMSQIGNTTRNAFSTPLGGIAYATAYNSLTSMSLDQISAMDTDLGDYVKKYGIDANAAKMYQQLGAKDSKVQARLMHNVIEQAGTDQAAITALANQYFGGDVGKAAQTLRLFRSGGEEAMMSMFSKQDQADAAIATNMIGANAKSTTTGIQVTASHGENLKAEAAIEHIEALDQAVVGLQKTVSGLNELLDRSHGIKEFLANLFDGMEEYQTWRRGHAQAPLRGY